MSKYIIKALMAILIPYLVVILPVCLVSGDNSIQLPKRVVLMEEFTGTWCGWCPYGADVLENILNRHENLIILAYHVNDVMEIELGKILSERFRPAYPQVVFDRQGSPLSRDKWETELVERFRISSPISIELDGKYNPDSRTMDVSAVFCAYENLYTQYRVNVIVVEDSVNYKQKIYDKPYTEIDPYYHNHVVRESITGPFGEVLNTAPFMKQSCLKKDYSVKLKPDFNPANCSIVVFINEDVSRQKGPVQQAAVISIMNDD